VSQLSVPHPRLAQYSTTPAVQASWDGFWLWQYTDGHYGPTPHTLPGLDEAGVDLNSFDGSAEKLIAEWASGGVAPQPIPPPLVPVRPTIVTVHITAPPGVVVKVIRDSGRSG
jgi:hypothetical protein